jgi:hypothetical protein
MARRGSYDWTEIRSFYELGHSASECQTLFRISNGAWYAATQRGDLVVRDAQAKPRTETRQAVASLIAAGLSQAEVARQLGVAKPTVCFHMRRLGISARVAPALRCDWAAIGAYYDSGHSAAECRARFGFGRDAWAAAIGRGAITPRPRLEPIEAILASGKRRSRQHVKARLLMAGLKEQRCEGCGLTDWLGLPISLELHHVNGDGQDNRLTNLRLLCPNCHSQTDTWGGRNKGRAGKCGISQRDPARTSGLRVSTLTADLHIGVNTLED